MSDKATPAKVRLTDGLDPLPENTLRQQAFLILSRLQSGTEDVVRLDVALAAVAAERERCAKLRTAAAQVLTDMRAQGVLLEWQTLMEEALRAERRLKRPVRVRLKQS